MATGTRKKTTQKKKTMGTTASKARKQREQQESFRNEVILWITLAVCIVLLLANFGIGGKIGSRSQFLFLWNIWINGICIPNLSLFSSGVRSV